MVWMILTVCALIALIAFVIEEIRTAPEVDDGFEVHLRNRYRAKATEAHITPKTGGRQRDTDAA